MGRSRMMCRGRSGERVLTELLKTFLELRDG